MLERLPIWMAIYFGTHVALALLTRFAVTLNWIDRPGGHKHHHGEVPVVGGIAVLLVVLAAEFIVAEQLRAGWFLLSGMAALLLIGVLDDRWQIPARFRVLAQALIVGIVAYATDNRLVDLGALWPGSDGTPLGLLSLPITVFCVVGVINAFNMIDGMDGLAVSLYLLIAGALLLLGLQHPALSGRWQLLAATSLAMLAFSAWNWPMRWRLRRVFLGDAGTLPLGLLLGYCLVEFSQGPSAAIAPVHALWLFAWPLIDTVSVMLRRWQHGVSAMQADQRHAHHLLLRAGFGLRATLLIVMVTQLSCVALAGWAARSGFTGPILAAGFLVFAFSAHGVMVRAERTRRLFGRPLAERVGEDRV